jgi:hypothetical protein
MTIFHNGTFGQRKDFIFPLGTSKITEKAHPVFPENVSVNAKSVTCFGPRFSTVNRNLSFVSLISQENSYCTARNSYNSFSSSHLDTVGRCDQNKRKTILASPRNFIMTWARASQNTDTPATSACNLLQMSAPKYQLCAWSARAATVQGGLEKTDTHAQSTCDVLQTLTPTPTLQEWPQCTVPVLKRREQRRKAEEAHTIAVMRSDFAILSTC